MLLTGWEPDHVTGPDLLDRSSPALREAAASRHDQGLAERVSVPCCPSARLERDTRTGRARRIGRLEQGIDADRAGKVVGWSLPRGLGAASLDFHRSFLHSLGPVTPARRKCPKVQAQSG